MNKKKKEEKLTEEESVVENLSSEETVASNQEPAGETAEENALRSLMAEVSQYKDNYLRATADFQNFKRRTEKEKADIYKYAGEKVLVDLLPIVDNIERAMSHVPEEEQSGLADGLRMIYKSLAALLDNHGVEAIEAVGTPFDPELHNAVQMVPSDDHEPHVVMEEYQKGYRLNGKVIRHSMVKVAE